ncbi:Transposable element Tc3 transposase [Araneus ventricosus]|uniref:Transposable element Tc3 transposase n=1 Tax=Araneus ventricosus TaxID=182803 RepID=A0A4Y2SI28_ARAVE|nr:Transposable element Tc3 transposase [Araneus ventricosus]
MKRAQDFSSRQSGSGTMMVWAAFGFNGKVGLAFLDGRQNSPKYIETLGNYRTPFEEHIGGRNREYQHDDAPIHISNATKNYLNSKTLTVLEWPPISLDLYPIENVWGIMFRKVYENLRQFYSVNALKTAIESVWQMPYVLGCVATEVQSSCGNEAAETFVQVEKLKDSTDWIKYCLHNLEYKNEIYTDFLPSIQITENLRIQINKVLDVLKEGITD